MHGTLLLEAGALLGALALGAILFGWLRQSVVPAFILVGMALRPLVGESDYVEQLATFGVVLLLFFMGLEFSLAALVRDRRQILRAGGLDLAASFPIGLIAGLAFGTGWTGALLLGGAFYISSSAIVAKSAIALHRTANPETALALGILVFEDLFIALFLAVLTGAVLAAEPSMAAAAWGVGRALLFFGLVVLIARRATGVLDRLFAVESDDVFLLLVGSVILLMSWAASAAGLSEAIGAFLAGLMLAETVHRDRAEHLFAPLQGLFAAIFFLGFGLLIDPSTFGGLWLYALALVALGIATKLAGGWWAGRSAALSPRASLALGLALIPRGEFSILLAQIALIVGLGDVAALITLLVLGLSLVGTTATQFSPALTRRIFPPAREPSLEEQGFSPELAGFDAGSPRARA